MAYGGAAPSEPRLGRVLERRVLVKLGAVVHGDRLMKPLMQKLLAARVRPYSIYQCNQVAGAEEFCTTVERGGWRSCGRCVVGRAASSPVEQVEGRATS